MTNTARSFRDKWERNPDLAFRQTLTEGSAIQTWILTRNGFGSRSELVAHLVGRGRLLDAGCGNGRVTALLAECAASGAKVMGIDQSSATVARTNLAGLPNVAVGEADLLGDLSELGSFDFVYCQEVLHHTGDAATAFANVAGLLAPGGELAVYVYRRKAPVREFTDDHVRDAIAAMPYEEAMDFARAMTDVGRALSALEATVEVPAVPVLGIEAGEYDIQRFVYHFFAKCFWSEELGREGSASVNYDWYHPQDCTRHTLDEVRDWFAAASLNVVHEHVDPYGITVRGVAPI